MPAPEDVERAARAIVEGIRMLEEGARKMRERAGKESQ